MDRVVINALQYKQNSSGIGVMLRDLFGPFSRLTKGSVRVVLPRDGPEFPAGAGTQLIRIPWDHKHSLRRMFYQTFLLGRMCRNAVLLTTDSKTPFFLPKNCKVVPLVTDLAVYRLPEVYRCSRVWWWKFQYRYLRRRADLFLAISEFTKQELTRILQVPEEKVHIIPCACSSRFRRVENLEAIKSKYGLHKPFLLFVGNSNPRKNLERLLRAFDALKGQENLPHQLVIAGEQGWKFDRAKVLAGIRYRSDIQFIGFVPDEDMPALYSASSLFVFPTLYEGFGIPVLEAQACGVPVLTSRCSSLPEVGGDGAFYVDPYDVASIAEGIRSVLTNAAWSEELVQRGLQNVKRFSWERSARYLDEIIEKEVRYE